MTQRQPICQRKRTMTTTTTAMMMTMIMKTNVNGLHQVKSADPTEPTTRWKMSTICVADANKRLFRPFSLLLLFSVFFCRWSYTPTFAFFFSYVVEMCNYSRWQIAFVCFFEGNIFRIVPHNIITIILMCLRFVVVSSFRFAVYSSCERLLPVDIGNADNDDDDDCLVASFIFVLRLAILLLLFCIQVIHDIAILIHVTHS